MFGISWTEFLVVLLVAICIVPAKNWPDVARFMGRAFKYIRNLVWKISDISEQIQQRIDLEKPIDDLIANASSEVFHKEKKKPVKKKTKSKKTK